jgi:hypothetical protein
VSWCLCGESILETQFSACLTATMEEMNKQSEKEQALAVFLDGFS